MLQGTAGDDVFAPVGGRDTLVGGGGHDIVQLAGQSSDYTMKVVDGNLVLSALNGSGVYTLSDIETLQFQGGQGNAPTEVAARLYEGILGRQGGVAEIEYWGNVLAHGATVDQVAHDFVASAESAALFRVTGATGFVRGLYETVLGRSAGQGEIDYWVSALGQGADRANVALGFINSAEKLAQPVTVDVGASELGVVTRLYQTMFGRAPDEAGLNYWLGERADGMSLNTIAGGFAGSAEAGTLTDSAFIDQLYHTGLHRDPTAVEMAGLLQLMHGGADRGNILLQVAESPDTVALVGVVTSTLALHGA